MTALGAARHGYSKSVATAAPFGGCDATALRIRSGTTLRRGTIGPPHALCIEAAQVRGRIARPVASASRLAMRDGRTGLR